MCRTTPSATATLPFASVAAAKQDSPGPIRGQSGMSSVRERPMPSKTVESLPRLGRPAATAGGRIDWPYAVSFGIYHAVALLACWPWLFSLDRAHHLSVGNLRIRDARHQSLLSPAVDASLV